MNFENPAWLYLTPLVVFFIGGFIAFGLRRRDSLLRQFAAARLLDRLTEKANMQRILIKAGLFLLACALIGLALARPQYGVNFVERKARGLDIVFVLDSSRSMLATDLKPTRLERARLAIMDLIDRLESDRIGLVVFAGNAFLQTPPTLDYSAFRENLNSVSPSSVSRGGSNIGQALREAAKAFPEDNNSKIVVLLTDGEDLEEEAIDTAREIAEDGIKVYSIGIGTPEGTYLKVRTEEGAEEFVRDSSGQPVRSRLDETTLREISQLTNGSYSRLAGQSLEAFYASVLSNLPREERESELQETMIERYQWVLFAAVFCLILETLIRRRKRLTTQIVTALVILSLAKPAPSFAEETGLESLTEPDAIETISDDPREIYNQAHKSLIKGNYAKAIELMEKAIRYSDDTKLEGNGLYNMAHASSQLGESAFQEQDFEKAIEYWKQAEECFESANELNPADAESLEDAKLIKARREALEAFLEQQKSQEQQQNESQDKQNQEDSESNSEDSESQPNNETNESEDPESDKDTSEQQQPENQENDSAQESSSQENDECSQSDQEEADEAETKDDKSEETDNSEATKNDASKSEEKEEEAASSNEEGENQPDTENGEAVQEISDETNTAEEGQKAVMVPEGMTLPDAQSLLDSLRNKERLLPFSEPFEGNGQTNKTRDW